MKSFFQRPPGSFAVYVSAILVATTMAGLVAFLPVLGQRNHSERLSESSLSVDDRFCGIDLRSANLAGDRGDRERAAADEFMLMMQGMAGIAPEESKWVSSKLFEGFVPAPMPYCGEPGSKNPSDEHECCERQVSAIDAANQTANFTQ